MPATEPLDRWAKWVLKSGHAADSEQLRKKLEYLGPVRDRILDHAQLQPRDTVLDVGCGDGLIGFGALMRLGDHGQVVFSDTSQALVEHCRDIASELHVSGRAEFIRADAEDLAPVLDESVDVITTRSVLIYVDDKRRAFGEFFRVLRPGGRVSLYEPINNYFPHDADDFWGFDARPVRDLVEKLWAYQGWTEEAHGDDPMMNFTERDLVEHALDAGFREVSVDLEVEVGPGSWVVDWERLLDLAPNPNAATTRELMERALTAEDRERFTSHMSPLVDSGEGLRRSAVAFLVARKDRG